jgi:signal transduction histidine kinase
MSFEEVQEQLALLVHELAQDTPGAFLHTEHAILGLQKLSEELETGVTCSAEDVAKIISEVVSRAQVALAFLETNRMLLDNLRSLVTGGLPPSQDEPEPLNLWTVIEECVDVFRRRSVAEHDLQFNVKLTGYAFLRGYESELRRACLNILHNAVKYSTPRPGGMSQRFVAVNGRYTIEQGAMVGISNVGVGILPQEIDEVIKKGVRGTLAKRSRKEGSGLGLAEADRVVRRHRGNLQITSEPLDKHGNVDPTVSIASLEHMHRRPWLTTIVIRLGGA